MAEHNPSRFENDPALITHNEARSMSVFCHDHPLISLRPRLASAGIVTARDLRRIPSGTTVRVTGLLIIVHTPPTRSGRRVMFITMEDETGLLDVVAFPKALKENARSILTSEVITVEGILQRQGKGGRSISIIMEKVIRPLSGPLSKFLPQTTLNQSTLDETGLPGNRADRASMPATKETNET